MNIKSAQFKVVVEYNPHYYTSEDIEQVIAEKLTHLTGLKLGFHVAWQVVSVELQPTDDNNQSTTPPTTP